MTPFIFVFSITCTAVSMLILGWYWGRAATRNTVAQKTFTDITIEPDDEEPLIWIEQESKCGRSDKVILELAKVDSFIGSILQARTNALRGVFSPEFVKGFNALSKGDVL